MSLIGNAVRSLRASAGRLAVIAVSLVLASSNAYAAAPGITVQSNQVITTTAGTLGVQAVGAGVPVVLRGVNFSGPEYACLQQSSFWDNPQGNQATIDAMLTWHANVVRLPLNEDCWLGINGAPPAYSGANYINAMATFVNLANTSGLIVEVDLHWGAGGSGLPTNDNYPALDADHAAAFWQSVASKFTNNQSVVFDLVNEPHITSWSCYRDGGCRTPKVGKLGAWTVVGTQSVVNTIRATGAKNPIIVAGLDYSNDLSQWLSFAPSDSAHAIIAGVHIYFDGLTCEGGTCWTNTFGSIQNAGCPVIVDEFGEFDCKHTKIENLMNWADARVPQVGYWAWAWTIAGCASGPSLITTATGNPTAYGVGFKNRLLSIQ